MNEQTNPSVTFSAVSVYTEGHAERPPCRRETTPFPYFHFTNPTI